jgi:magnesium transporter
MPLTAIHRDAAGHLRLLSEEREIAAAVGDREGLTWVSITRTSEADTALLGRVFGFHPLALQDCLNARYQRPKVDEYADYLFLMLHGVDHVATEELVATTELDLFVGRNFVVSAHLAPVPAVETLAEQAAAGEPRHLERGAAMLAHALVDALVDSVLPTVDRMGDVADTIEEEALERPERELLQAIMRLKRSALRIGRVMGPQRDLLASISRGEYAMFPAETAIYFRDVYDHLARIEDLTQTLRERADYAMTTYHSAISIRQNESMRVLSIVASIFLPLTLLAGIYGMNVSSRLARTVVRSGIAEPCSVRLPSRSTTTRSTNERMRSPHSSRVASNVSPVSSSAV